MPPMDNQNPVPQLWQRLRKQQYQIMHPQGQAPLPQQQEQMATTIAPSPRRQRLLDR